MNDNSVISCGTYVFFANRISGISGGPLYIRNKKRFLESIGWKVIVVTQPQIDKEPIVIEEFKQYSNNVFSELAFPPSWMSAYKRERFVKKFLKLLGAVSEVVIESNHIAYSLWGELLAKRIHCQHIIYMISEHEVIQSKQICDFFYSKLKNGEFYCISPKVCSNLFSNFYAIEDLDRYVWHAGCSNDVEDVYNDRLDAIQPSDFNVGFFGRLKPFVPDMFKEFYRFCNLNKNISINLICLGLASLPDEINVLSKPCNLNLFLLGNLSPIPRAFFQKTDLIIATAACASMSYRQGSVVISMNVETHKPLGILGLTTNSSTFVNKGSTYAEDATLESLLNRVLKTSNIIDDIDFEMIPKNKESVYLRHMESIKSPVVYFDTLFPPYFSKITQLLQYLVVKIGGDGLLMNVKRLIKV